jgi:O-antigen/teichoic acid export membrane protein
VRGAVVDRQTLRKLASISLVLTLMAAPVLCGIMFTVAAFVGNMTVGIWAAIALLLWQVQETLRRTLMAELRFGSAIWGDAISYLGQLLCVWYIASHGQLSLTLTYQAIALTSSLAVALQAVQVGLRPVQLSELKPKALEYWRLGRWLLLGNLTTLVTGTLFVTNLAIWAGYARAGVYSALVNVALRPVHPLMFAIATLITPNVARARASEGMQKARHVLYRHYALGLAILSPYLLLILLVPTYLLQVLYRAQSAEYEPWSYLLNVLVFTAVFVYTATAMGAFLNAIERPRLAFMAQLAYTCCMLLVAMPLTMMFGVVGAVVGASIAGLVHAGAGMFFVLSTRRQSLAVEPLPPSRAQAVQT